MSDTRAMSADGETEIVCAQCFRAGDPGTLVLIKGDEADTWSCTAHGVVFWMSHTGTLDLGIDFSGSEASDDEKANFARSFTDQGEK